MLILTRRVGESIAIGSDVTITVLAIKGNQARLGIAAPQDVPVHRVEISERIKDEVVSSRTHENSVSAARTQTNRR